MNMLETLQNLLNDSGFVSFFADGGWKNLVMIAVSCLLLYLGIKKQFEPLLLVGIAFGCLLVNVSNFFVDGASSANALYHPELWNAFLEEGGEYYHSYGHIMANGGLLDILYIGVKSGLYPSLIFLGHRCDDRLRSAAVQPEEPAAGCSRTDGCIPGVLRRSLPGL